MTGPGSTVAKVLEGRCSPHKITGIAGVANMGDTRNWCEHPFAQANASPGTPNLGLRALPGSGPA